MHRGELFRGASGLIPDLGDLLFLHPGLNGHNTPDRLAAIVSSVAGGNAGAPIDADAAAYATIGDAIGIAVANLITLFAPPKVILAGAALSAGDILIKPLRQAVAEFTPSSLADIAEIVIHEWDDETWARGAAAMTLRDLYGASWNTTGPAHHRH
jgi:predicted NBD/HSP70 family sugar kinase